jgi:ATP-dependent exoDNAse (exonuclease V) alpha subunit
MVVRSTVNAAGNMWKVTNGTRYYVNDISLEYIQLKDANGCVQNVPLNKVLKSDFQVAYAITVHKSQGTEARNVRYVFRRNRDFSNAFSTDKTLKYVAFSRAKESITLHEVYSPKDSANESIILYLNDSKLYDMSI